MVIVSSAVLGAAAGTGLALVVAVTVVVYRFYLTRRHGKQWAELDQWAKQRNARQINLRECSVGRELHSVQPPTEPSAASAIPAHLINVDALRGPLEVAAAPSPMHSCLQHQSKSFPARLTRTPSISSQSSVDSAPSRNSSHRGSSPQIRTFAPDGRNTFATDHQTFQYPRSPSPLRAVSLDARGSSPGLIDTMDMRSSSPSQSSLPTFGMTGAYGTMPPVCHSPKFGRCLSPLPITSRTAAGLGLDAGCGPSSPLGTLQLDLYTRNDGPVYLDAPDSSHAIGRIHLRIGYDSNLFDLAVHLIEAHNLNAEENGGFRDPYVRLSLAPEVDQRKRQTSIHRGQSHPYFDQHFKFPVSRDQLQGKLLVLEVLDYDRYSHNDIVGELRIAIDEIDLSKSVEIWGDLLRVKKIAENRPEILISLNYLPSAERLTVVIMKAKNLEVMHESFVKVYLIVNGKRTKKKKTTTIKANDLTNPIWNEAFTFNLASSATKSSAIEIYVVSTGGAGGGGGASSSSGESSNGFGSCGIGPQEQGAGRQHWQDMMFNTRKPTAMWHYLH